jgi:HEAT repeat protein
VRSAVAPFAAAIVEDPEVDLRRAAVRVLVAIGDVDHLDVMAHSDPSTAVRREAMEGLGWIGDPEAILRLAADLGGTDSDQRRAALQAVSLAGARMSSSWDQGLTDTARWRIVVDEVGSRLLPILREDSDYVGAKGLVRTGGHEV